MTDLCRPSQCEYGPSGCCGSGCGALPKEMQWLAGRLMGLLLLPGCLLLLWMGILTEAPISLLVTWAGACLHNYVRSLVLLPRSPLLGIVMPQID